MKLHEQLFRVLNSQNIALKDIQYLPMVEEFRQMKAKGHKVAYITCFLSTKYKLTERGIFKIVRRFEESIEI